jgi:hypothetical protein
MWAAWGLALAGGLAVMLALVLTLRDPCLRHRVCDPGSLATARALALAGASTAAAGLGAALWLLARRP